MRFSLWFRAIVEHNAAGDSVYSSFPRHDQLEKRRLYFCFPRYDKLNSYCVSSVFASELDVRPPRFRLLSGCFLCSAPPALRSASLPLANAADVGCLPVCCSATDPLLLSRRLRTPGAGGAKDYARVRIKIPT
ncbi:hypothetical protein ACJRO7_001875 [Eucalyptus globulus]|uniref:Uncharacterized protein n=1 Tax=Eucalyptus globulus TaxID=34317 RepID=A0ABD3LXY8_EUCGL